MKRKEFIKRSSFAIGATAISGVVAKTIESQSFEHIKIVPNLVIIALSGGIRNEDVFNENGIGLMPNLINLSKDSLSTIHFKDIQCPTNNHVLNLNALIFGGVSDNSSNQFPSVFECFLKNEQLSNRKKQYNPLHCWYLAENIGNKFTHLAFSDNSSFGKKFGANTSFNSDKNIISNSELTIDQLKLIENHSKKKSLLHNQFPELNAISNNVGLVNKFKNTALLLNDFQPKLLTVNISDMDICHSNFSGYQDVLTSIDKGIDWLINYIQNLEAMKNNTIVLVISTLGRNENPNSIKDKHNKLSYDHHDKTALKSWAVLKNLSQLKISKSINSNQTNVQLADINNLCCQLLQIDKSKIDINHIPVKNLSLVDIKG